MEVVELTDAIGEIGYQVKTLGKGIATEVAKELAKYGLENELKRLTAKVFLPNKASAEF